MFSYFFSSFFPAIVAGLIKMFKGQLLSLCSSAELKTPLWLPFETKEFKLKRYVRRDAGQTNMRTNEIRPPKVLEAGTVIMIQRCVEHTNNHADDAINWFLDRSRAIRQDFVAQSDWIASDAEQQKHYLKSMLLLTRYLVSVCFNLPSGVDVRFFDDALAACISNVLHTDRENVECQTYAQLVFDQKFYFQRSHVLMQCRKERNWIRFKREFASCGYLVQCAARRRVVSEVQFTGLQVLNSSFMGKFPIDTVVDWLGFGATEKEVVLMVQQCGIPVVSGNVEFKKSLALAPPSSSSQANNIAQLEGKELERVLCA